MSESALGRLHDLAMFVSANEDLRTNLRELVDLTASVTDAAACSIMLLSEGEGDPPRLKVWCSTQSLPAAVGEPRGSGESIAGRVIAQGKPILITDIRASPFASLAAKRTDLGASFISTPISVGKQAIGVMNLSSRAGSPAFDESDLRLAEVVATLIGKSIQVERLQTLLRSKVAHASLAREAKEVTARLTDGTVPPARVAKLLAKSFFRDLTQAGFDPAQIIEAASELITLVSGDLGRYKKRAERQAK